MAHQVKQPGRPFTVQQLRAHRDAPGIGARKLVDGHHFRLATSPDGPGWAAGPGTRLAMAGDDPGFSGEFS